MSHNEPLQTTQLCEITVCDHVVFCCSRQQIRGGGVAKSQCPANGQPQYAPGFTDTNRPDDDDEFYPKHCVVGQVVLGGTGGKRPYAEYHSSLQRRPMDVQRCDHVTSLPRAATNGGSTLTEVNRNSYG